MKNRILTFALLLAWTAAGVFAADESTYDYTYDDGLYSTVTLSKRLNKHDVENEKSVKLSNIPGFAKELKVRVAWQREDKKRIANAPLVVVLLGLNGRIKDDLAEVWQGLLYESGCHVLTFDSVFGADFGKCSNHGVAGNVIAEAEAAAKVVEAFLAQPGVNEHIASVNLFGTSYGGTVSLQVARLGAEGKLPFKLGKVVAFSPTVALKSSARILDACYTEDFGKINFDRMKLLKLRDRDPVPAGAPPPFEDSYMKAGVGYVFKEELKKVIEKNDKQYDLGQLEQFKRSDDPRGDSKGWTFTQYVEEMAFPYWQAKGAFKSADELWAAGDLRNILPAAGENVRAYIAADDPLNDPSDLAALKSAVKPPRLNVIPHGGHLGYADAEWVKKVLDTAFKP
ncbi:MAG: alpha/beta fold hydrolase [Planctomycetes bacterium]|nr:alpha/beta fold hydrolase [Planctomycetota bacterium]